MKLNIPRFENFSLRDAGANLVYKYKANARNDLFEQIDCSLLLFEDYLINTATGEYRQIKPAETSRAGALAEAARSLLSPGRESSNILLLLPPTDFVATSYNMAVHGEQMVRSALQLQAHSLIPAYNNELLLAVDAHHSEGVALWYPAQRADQLFEAFAAQGLFLAAIMPRSLAASRPRSEEPELLIRDDDARNATLVLMRGARILALLTVSHQDLQQEAFAEQWEQATAQHSATISKKFARLEDWTRLRQDWSGLRHKARCLPSYCFLPSGAREFTRQLEAQKRKKLGAGVAAALVVLLCLPFLINWIQLGSLERRMATLTEQTVDVREMQAAVFTMEEEWGAVYDYPRQQVASVLQSLNEVIQNSLTAFSINKGVIDIQGYAQDPALLVEELATKEEFYNVAQSRSISGSNSSSRGDRFGIRMRLRGADFAEYERKYPVDGN